MSLKYTENLLGINPDTIAKIPIIGSAKCEILSYKPDIKLNIPSDKKEVKIEWPSNQAINGGRIYFMFSDKITSGGFSEGSKKFIVTYHETDKEDYWHSSPHEGVASIFTSLATINRAAEIANKEIQHVVIANRHTVKFFERLRNVGLYSYADLQGNLVPKPKKTPHGILYTTKFPIKGLKNILSEFEVEQAAIFINNLRS